MKMMMLFHVKHVCKIVPNVLIQDLKPVQIVMQVTILNLMQDLLVFLNNILKMMELEPEKDNVLPTENLMLIKLLAFVKKDFTMMHLPVNNVRSNIVNNVLMLVNVQNVMQVRIE